MDYKLLTNDALEQYNIQVKKISFLRHNENYTQKITDNNNESYLLRIHDSNNLTNIGQHTHAALLAEMKILTEVRRQTSIKAQKPISNKEESMVSTVKDEKGNEINATLLKWIQGETLDYDHPEYETHLYQTGTMLAEFHNFSMNWKDGKKLNRPIINANYLDKTFKEIHHGVSIGIISKEQYQLIKQAISKIKAMFGDLKDNYSNKWHGISHNDISKSNLIVTKKSIIPIDFNLSTINYLFCDIADFIASLYDKASAKIFLDGYSSIRDIEQKHIPFIEMFYVLSIIEFMKLNIKNKRHHNWFNRRLPNVCKDYIKPMLAGESFFHMICD